MICPRLIIQKEIMCDVVVLVLYGETNITFRCFSKQVKSAYSMKRIMLINSPLFEETHDLNKEDYLPPLGLGVIATELMKHSDIRVQFLDAIAENKTVSEILSAISESQSDFVGINIFTTNFKLVKKIIEETKRNTQFIIGGISTRSLYSEISKWETQNPIDIVYGDGERIAGDIVHSCVKEKPTKQSKKTRFFIVSKESLYYVKDISQEAIDRSLFRNEPYLNCYERPEVSIYTSRGCIYSCAYCVAASAMNRQLGVRIKNVPSIIAELTAIKSRYSSVEYIRVLDDLFLRSAQSFTDANTIFSQFDFSWRAMCHIKPLYQVDVNSLRRLRDNGCKELFVGIESGSTRILNKIHKETNLDVISRATEKVFQAGINLKGYFICGFPTETQQDLEDTISLAINIHKQAQKHGVRFRTSTFQFRPYHGTELHNELIQLSPQKDSSSVLFETKNSDWMNDAKSRKAFNFDSGNYAAVADEVLQNCIRRMNALNGTV